MYILEGKISVKAALMAKKRVVKEILIEDSKVNRDINFIVKKAQEENIKVDRVQRNEIDKLCEGKTHGGIIAKVEERNFQTLSSLPRSNSFLALVEGVEDPFNFGSILRSLYAAGCKDILLPQRNWTSAASTLAKSSAGASEFMNIYICEDFEETLKKLKQKGIKIVCANRDKEAVEMYECDFTMPICICIGGEKRGLSKSVLNASEQNVYIPYNTDFKNALSAASATTILAYEVMRQRKI